MKKLLLLVVLLVCGKAVMPQFVPMPLNYPQDTCLYIPYWMSIVDENTVWVGTARLKFQGYKPYSKAVKTTDGGNTWQFYDIPIPGIPWIQHLSALDANTCYYLITDGATYGGYIMKTTDGGITWQKKSSTQFSGGWGDVIHVFSADTVVAIGDPNGGYIEVQFSANGGDTWTQIPSTDIPAALTGETGTSGEYCAVGNSIWFPTNKGRCYYSHDRGLHWGVSTVTTDYILVSFTSEQNGIGYVPAGQNIYVTNDGGATWLMNSVPLSFPAGFITNVPGIENGYVATNSDTTQLSVYYTDNCFLTTTTLESNIINGDRLKFKSPAIGWLGGDGRPINAIHKFTDVLQSVYEKPQKSMSLVILPNPARNNVTVSLPASSAPIKKIRTICCLS